ncbi:type II methionyl aminopeptidase [Vulcanisaeta souniana JCM 11219]|uniref:Methionine aminopeptidase n=1 Tax=Vulcanisaeta souniana JCM 11219 TaxID=1293586 RepID=A0ABM8BLX1_9CREN|nr:type II methionyl aminopeptidase [Vulcanisaeta souniana JCM 11219]
MAKTITNRARLFKGVNAAYHVSTDLLKIYEKLGSIARDALNYAMSIIEPGIPIFELCDRVENRIRQSGAKPAFPVNVSINEIAAHYTAVIGDKSVIPKGSIIKIDLGAHIDGYIVDTAVTVTFNPMYSQLIKASMKALETAQLSMKPGVTLTSIGAQIERVIRSYGFKPIKNLSGHLIRKYELHAGKSVPNYDNGDKQRINDGEVYAVEPFSTNGAGYVDDGEQVTIYQLIKNPRTKDPHYDVLSYISNEIGPLPFTPRWLVPRFGDGIGNLIHELHMKDYIYGYPVLIEHGKGMVAQVEDTFIITKDGAVPVVNVLSLLK